MSLMTPLVLVDAQGQELGRCSVECGVKFERAQSVDLGAVGYFSILSVRGGDPMILIAEPAERNQLAYDLVIREDGFEHLRAQIAEHSLSVGDRLKWPPERGQDPVDHEVVAIRPASDDRRAVIVIERLA